MKDLILDEFSQTEIRKQLEPNEIVIWEGRPYRNGWGGVLFFIVMMSCFFFMFLFAIGVKSLWILLLMIVVDPLEGREMIRTYMASKNTKYLITKERVVFQFYEKKKKRFLSVPFEEIEKINFQREVINFKDGDIYLRMKRREVMSLIFYNRAGNQAQPILELIKNVEEVAGYIKMGIQGKL